MDAKYSDTGFWAKIRRFAATAGRGLIEKALTLYYTAQDPRTPAWAKAMIFAALAYFISPVDAVPDVIPGVGLADDLGILASAFATVAAHVTPDAVAKARATLATLFGLSPEAA